MYDLRKPIWAHLESIYRETSSLQLIALLISGCNDGSRLLGDTTFVGIQVRDQGIGDDQVSGSVFSRCILR